METERTLPVPAPTAVKAYPVALHTRGTLEDALQCILQNCLAHVEANVAGVLAQDAECLHQMRVGLRRLRAALGLFKSKVQLPAGVQKDLDWLAALLGKARDWDVFIGATLEQVGGAGWNEGRAALRDSASAHAAATHHAVQRALQARRYARLISGLSRWIADRQWRRLHDGVRPGKLDRNVRQGMRPLLDKAQRRLHKKLRMADQTDTASLHQVRIAAKKSRYAMEFFQPLLPAKRVNKQVRRLTALQDLLGSLNDLAIAGELLAQLGRDAAAPQQQLAFAQGYLASVADAKMQALRKPLRRARSVPLI